MLPSTGFFRSINCPFFENNLCKRPFCHYKHVKKNEEVSYTPTPKAVLESQTKKLAYIPMPTYTATSKAESTEKVTQPDVEGAVFENDVTYSPIAEDHVGEECKTDKLPKKEAATVDKVVVKPQEIIEVTTAKASDDKHRHHKSSSSHTKSSSHKSSSSSKSRHSDKDKEKERRHSRDSDKERKHSSSSSRSKKSEHRDKDKEKQKEKSKHDSKHRSSKSSSSSSRHSSHSSSHKSLNKDRDTTRKEKSDSKEKTEKKTNGTKEVVEPKFDFDDQFSTPLVDTDISSGDEDDIMAECEKIFQEYQPKPETVKATPEETAPKSTNLQVFDMFEENVAKKRRVAYEGASTTVSKTATSVVRKVNHSTVALQSVYHRQEIVKQQQEERAAHEAAERAAEEERNQARIAEKLEATRKMLGLENKSSNTQSSTLLGKRPFSMTPVSNIMAIQNAKKKIDELREKRDRDRNTTPCQTAKRGAGGRVAHANLSTKPTTTAVITSKGQVEVTMDKTRSAPPVLDAGTSKISFNIRTQYYNMMVTHCLNIYDSCDDAWDRAQTEELAVVKKCNSAMIYKSSALLTINKLRKESIDAGNINTDKNKTISHDLIIAGKLGRQTSWSVNKKQKIDSSNSTLITIDNASPTKAYELVLECILTDDQLKSNGYPRPSDTPGKALLHVTKKSKPTNDEERYCSRCAKVYNLSIYEEVAVDMCNYHPKRTGHQRGFVDTLHRCCQQPANTDGCMFANYHVTDYKDIENLTEYVTTIDRDEDYVPTKRDIFALDCEMCYTTGGIELTRITVVNMDCKTVYDSLVKPTNQVVDYNTVYSGITEQMLATVKTTLLDVQAVLLSMFHSKTILIGHSLESDLNALKIIHNVVVDTSVLFPHRQGPPLKRALKTLCIENLKRIIQESDEGHDSAEDAEVCIHLVKHYLRNRIV